MYTDIEWQPITIFFAKWVDAANNRRELGNCCNLHTMLPFRIKSSGADSVGARGPKPQQNTEKILWGLSPLNFKYLWNARSSLHKYIYTHTHPSVYLSIYLSIYLYIYIHAYIHAYVRMHTHIYKMTIAVRNPPEIFSNSARLIKEI